MEEAFTLEDLRGLAKSRNYRLVRKEDHYWLIDRRDRLPIANEADESLYFTAEEARALLDSLTASTPS